MSNNILLNNAYGILGLLPNSSQKEVSRRLKEIEKFLLIDENPEYPYDFGIYDKKRNLPDVRQAFHNISTHEKQILHYFFRIYANNTNQTKILDSFNKNCTFDKITNDYENSKTKPFIFKKNIAIILTLKLLQSGTEDEKIYQHSIFCINLWFDILNTEKSFSDFKKIFLLDDELGMNDSCFNGLKEHITNELTVIFSDISQIHKNNRILMTFIENFGLKDSIINIDYINNIYDEINSSVRVLDGMNISEDGIFDDNEKAQLKSCLQVFQDKFNELADLGLYDNEKTVILRDLVATKIRIQTLDLHNNLSESSAAYKLIQFAIYICGTNGLKNKLQTDMPIIRESAQFKEIEELLNETVKCLNKSYPSEEQTQIYMSKLISKKNELIRKYNISEIPEGLSDYLAIELRSVAIDYHNKKNLYKQSAIIMNTAYQFAASSKWKYKCIEDLSYINNTVSKNTIPAKIIRGLGRGILTIFYNIIVYLLYIGFIALICNIIGFIFSLF